MTSVENFVSDFYHYSNNTYTFVMNCDNQLKRFYYNFGKFSLNFKTDSESWSTSTTTYVSCSKGSDILNTSIVATAANPTALKFIFDKEMYPKFTNQDNTYFKETFDAASPELAECKAANNLCQLSTGDE